MKSKEELIKVWLDSDERVASGQYSMDLEFFKSESTRMYKLLPGNNICKISVENRDCIEVAGDLAKLGKTAILNMASYKNPGGGVKRGSMAQEEELARRSNLMWGLPGDKYPLGMNDFIYTKNVTFFKDKNYEIMSPFNADVITIAAINLNGLPRPSNYTKLTLEKMSAMLLNPHMEGCENLVLSAFGCGVFKNDPEEIASLFVQKLNSFSNFYKNITFAILNDRNSVGSNFEIFQNIIK